MNDKDIEQRMKLSRTITEKHYSGPLREKIMIICKPLKSEDREALAKKCIPIVEASKTEQEALEQILKLAKQE